MPLPTLDPSASPARPAWPPASPSRPAGRAWSAFTAYARWLDAIAWTRFAVLSLLLLAFAEILSELPPFSIPWGADRFEPRRPPDADRSPVLGSEPIRIQGVKGSDGRRYEIRIDGQGVQVRALPAPPASPASAPDGTGLPPAGAATEPTPREMAEAVSEAREALEDAGLIRPREPKPVRVRAFRLGDALTQLALGWVVLSIVVKLMAAGRFRAEAEAEVANEKAEAESLRRQVVEARLSAMQAQVEPHFLFNTLASIEHLIETDPPKAGRMQRNLIALLRASMPSLREAGNAGPRELARELEVIRPYLEILRVRMDDRLQTRIDVPAGLLSAECPPMMVQGLVENAIKHGLEPKAEGGTLTVTACIEHGRLVLRVADTGLGLGAGPGTGATVGSGVGLANIRERLALLYGDRAALELGPNTPTGTVATLTLPYRSLQPGTVPRPLAA